MPTDASGEGGKVVRDTSLDGVDKVVRQEPIEEMSRQAPEICEVPMAVNALLFSAEQLDKNLGFATS